MKSDGAVSVNQITDLGHSDVGAVRQIIDLDEHRSTSVRQALNNGAMRRLFSALEAENDSGDVVRSAFAVCQTD